MAQPSPDLFAEKALDYDARPLPQRISEGVSAALAARVPLRPGMTVIDFGAGTGMLSGRLAPRVGAVLAVDVSPAMLAQLAAKPELQGKVEPICHDLLAAPLGRHAHLAVSAMAMHHVEDTAALLRALYDHLLPGGWIAVADLDREDGDFHPPNTVGVFHSGFDRAHLAGVMRQVGFEDVVIETACTVEKNEKGYGIFLATGRRGEG